MADLTLNAQSPLGGYSETIGQVTMAEVPGKALISAAVPQGGDAAFAKALVAGFGASRPATGEYVTGKKHGAAVLGLQPDQVMILFDEGTTPGIETAAAAMKDAAYLTDQSDSWVMLQVSGADARTALERICPLDLQPDAFPENKVARTAMEHLGVIVLRDGADSFLMLSARSSAKSFLHAVEVSARNVA